MPEILMVTNSASGSYDAALADEVADRLGVTRHVVLPDDDLPTSSDAADVERIVILTGDGTISSTVAALGRWGGELIVLPGGTMNLLSRKLHGDADARAIVERIVAGKGKIRQMPLIQGCDHHSLVGIIAGPTTAWGDVREDMRRLNLAALAASVPVAFSETLGGGLVSIKGDAREYQAIFIDAEGDKLVAEGVRASNAAELASHGLAWLRGDFLGGPSERLGEGERFTVQGPARIGLLVDGERSEVEGPCTFTLGRCPLSFVATR